VSMEREYLIVDGYNIINNWPDFAGVRGQDLAHAREHLAEILANYQALSGKQVILVFDAHQVKGPETVEYKNGMQVIYTGQGKTADQVIEQLVYSLGKGYAVTVATSDWLEQRLVLGKDGLRISARELRLLVMDTLAQSKRHYQVGEASPTLAHHLKADQFQVLERMRRQR